MCNADCSAAACGDTIVNITAGETRDAGGETDTCDLDCTAAECGAYTDAYSQAQFVIPFLDGYLDWIANGAP